MSAPKGCKVCKLDEPMRSRLRALRLAGQGSVKTLDQLPELRAAGVTRLNIDHHHATCDPVKLGDSTETLGKIAAILARSGIPIDEIDRVREISLKEWQGFHKTGPKGEEYAVKVDLEGAGIKLTPKWAAGPDWPLVQPATVPTVRFARPKPTRARGGTWRRAVVLPDPQIGFRRLEDGTLDPFHDERAIDVALQVAADAEPDMIVNLGDFLDLSEASKFLKEPGFVQTTQPSLQYGAEFLAKQRAIVGPDGRIVYIEGNHDYRLKRSILENAAWAFGLKRAQHPDSWPVLSVPALMGFDELGVDFVEGYPAGIFYVNDNLACVHGERVRSGGSTAAAIIDDERVSLICGHVHRIEEHFKTVRTPRGPRTRLALSAGCLCRIDGAVPSTKTGVRHDGRSPDRIENWQQAVTIVTYEEGDGRFDVDCRPIFDGTAFWNGRVYEARVEPEWARRAAA